MGELLFLEDVSPDSRRRLPVGSEDLYRQEGMSQSSLVDCTVLLPCKNERETMRRTLPGLMRRLQVAFGSRQFELIVIENGSTDQAIDIPNEILELPNLRMEEIAVAGRGPAIKHGVSRARGQLIFILSIDRAWDESFVEEALPLLDGEFEFVFGQKSHPASKVNRPWFRQLASLVTQRMVSVLFQISPQDTQGIRAFRRSSLTFVHRLSDANYFFDTEFFLEANLGHRCVSIPVRVRDFRKQSKVRIHSFFEFSYEALAYRNWIK